MTAQLTIPQTDLHVVETLPFTALVFTTRATLPTLAKHGHVPEELYTEADRLGLVPAGPLQYIYTGVMGSESAEFGLEIVLPIGPTTVKPFGFRLKTFEPFRCVSYTYAGSWGEFMPMYDALFATFNRGGYRTDNRLREVYTVIDMKNPANCVTDIQIGLI